MKKILLVILMSLSLALTSCKNSGNNASYCNTCSTTNNVIALVSVSADQIGSELKKHESHNDDIFTFEMKANHHTDYSLYYTLIIYCDHKNDNNDKKVFWLIGVNGEDKIKDFIAMCYQNSTDTLIFCSEVRGTEKNYSTIIIQHE